MNIAFSALVILFLALPGVILFVAYRSERGRPISSGPLADEIPLGLVVSVVLHGIWVVLFDFCGGKLSTPLQVDLKTTLRLLAAQFGKDDGEFESAVSSIVQHAGWILLYFGSLYVFAAIAGYVLKSAVRFWRLDRLIPMLRWNDWYYLLKGESPEDYEEPDDQPRDFLKITAVVGDYIYIGVLVDFAIKKSGELDSVVLTEPKRRKIGEKETPPDVPSYYPIHAEFLILKYSEIKNLCITKYTLPLDVPAEPPLDTTSGAGAESTDVGSD